MADGDLLSRKLGPLTGVQWAMILGGIAVIYWYYRGRSSSTSSTTAATTAAAQAAAADQQAADTASSAMYGAGSLDTSSTSTSTTGATYPDNNTWSVAAVNWLVSVGDDATTANAAIQAWLNGQTLTSDQQAMVNLAIGHLGEPPNPPATGSNGSIPTTGSNGSAPGGPTSIATNIPNAGFWNDPNGHVSYDDIASELGVFSGNGEALYQYNLLPNKHTPQTKSSIQNSYPYPPKGELIAYPVKGYQIMLPVVGVVTS